MSPNKNNDSSNPENPNKYLEIPKWVNEEYFHPIVEKDVKDFVRIKNFTSIAATQPGENYTSVMVRVLIDIEVEDGSERKVSYILKTMLQSDKGGDVISGMNLFPKEKQMYQVHIPNFTKLYKEAGVEIELAPKCLHIDESPDCITLVMEDLKQQNFANVDRLKGLDLEHMTRVLRKLAEFHAASAVTYEQNGPFEEVYSQSMYVESNRALFEGLGHIRHETYVKAMREWQLPDVEEYIKILPTPESNFEVGLRLNEIDESEFNCLNHGDLWSNNIMFSGDRTLFVDLQVGKWGTPAQDLWYFITTSASLDIKVKEFDNFIQIYHTRLEKCLKLLKYSKPIPTLRELHVMMIKYGDFGPMTANGVMDVVLMPSDKDANINTMFLEGPEGDAYRYRTFINPYYVKAMLQLCPFFKNKGLI